MRILMIAPGMQHSLVSGVGVAAENIAKKLSKNFQLKLIQAAEAPSIEPQKNQTALQDTFSVQSTIQDIVKIISTPLQVYETSPTKQEISSSEVQNQLHFFTEEVIIEAAKEDFDVIYAHDWISFPAGIELKKKLNKPLVLHVHSLDTDRISETHHSWVYEEELKGFKAADAIITVSSYTADRLIQHYQINPEKVHVIHNGIDLPKIKHTGKKRFHAPLVVFVGRLAEQKGGATFIQIAAEILKTHPDVRFVLAGDGALKADLTELVVRKKIGHRVHFTGHLSQSKVWELLAEADVFCLPSKSEPFGLATLEAAAAGLPVVISKQSGVAEVLPEAITPDHQDVLSFSSAILKLISDEKETQNIGSKNKQAATLLTWEATATKVGEALKTVL